MDDKRVPPVTTDAERERRLRDGLAIMQRHKQPTATINIRDLAFIFARIDDLTEALGRARNRLATKSMRLEELQANAKEVVRSLSDEPETPRGTIASRLLHYVIESRTVDIEMCVQCGGINNLPTPAFVSDEKWCHCAASSPLEGSEGPTP